MFPPLLVLFFLSRSIVFPPETIVFQVAPYVKPLSESQRSSNRNRAVIIIHGLGVHPFSKMNVARAQLHPSQKPSCLLVRVLAQESDVYAFAYSQQIAVEDIAADPSLRSCVCRLKDLGYDDIVIVGYSAGGLIARQFIEDNPDAPVNKVIQVCSPNAGSSWAEFRAVLPNQSKFLYSLSKESRNIQLKIRSDKRIPEKVQYACIAGTGTGVGDGLVLCTSAWTPDLQAQGIPVYPVNATHWQVPRVHPGVDLIAELVRQPLERWSTRRITAARKMLFRE